MAAKNSKIGSLTEECAQHQRIAQSLQLQCAGNYRSIQQHSALILYLQRRTADGAHTPLCMFVRHLSCLELETRYVAKEKEAAAETLAYAAN